MQALWTWPDLIKSCNANPQEEHGPDITGISIDTRTLKPGDLFVALDGNPGERFHTSHRAIHDGHDFVSQAAEAGAAALLVHRPVTSTLPQILVGDTLDALWNLARAARQRLRGRVYAITGSSGKTTAKTFLNTALGLAITNGSLNNFWGVPLSLARTPARSVAAVFELGTSHPGEIGPLSSLVRPDIALLLNVYPAHVENFKNLDELRREKLAITSGLSPRGVLIVPGDLDLSAAGNPRIAMTFGGEPGDDVQLLRYDPRTNLAHILYQGRSIEARVPGGGAHRAMTLTATAACLLGGGVRLEALQNLPDSLVPQGRGSRQQIKGITLIDDSYNANPASMRAALTALASESSGGRSFVILGDMLELGDASLPAHKELAQACSGLTGVTCVGPHMEELYRALPAEQRLGQMQDVSEFPLLSWAGQLEPGDRVLVKGSNRIFWTRGFVQQLIEAIKATGSSGETKKTRRGGSPGKFH